MAFAISNSILLFCGILGIHGSIIQLLQNVSREHAQCLCLQSGHDTQWHTCLDFQAVERTAHISAQSATACHRICVLCLWVWMHRDEFSYKSLVKFSACTATCITWSKSKCSDMKKRAQSTNPSQRFFYLYLPLHTPAQGDRIGKISDWTDGPDIYSRTKNI